MSSAAQGTRYFHPSKTQSTYQGDSPNTALVLHHFNKLKKGNNNAYMFSILPILSYMPRPTTTLKIILFVSFWLQNTIFAFRNASPASEQTTIPANCFSLHQDQPHLPICISFSIMRIHVYLLSAMQALSFTAYTASGKSYCSLFLYNSYLNLLLE